MSSITRIIVWTIVIAAAIAIAYGQPKPDFSGTWKLNPSQSNYTDPRVAVPDSLVWKLEHRRDHLLYIVEGIRQGKKNGFTADINIGGGAFESDEAAIITARWQGASLAVQTVYNPGNERRASMDEVWTLSEDGTTLTDSVLYHVPKTAKNQSDVIFKRVFDKQ
jgi:hypothetical protein